MVQYDYMNIFFMEKSHHRRFKTETSGDEYASPTVGALITNGLRTGGDKPSYHQQFYNRW